MMGSPDTSTPETVAEAFLVALRDRGVDRLFVNAGTDFATIVEAYARQKESGLGLPEVIVCAHENLAVSMAHGSCLGDGRVQAVMLHTSVGSANAVCAVSNAASARVPVLLSAGRTPLFEDSILGSRDYGIHWAQEMFDQAGMLRELVKWDYELRDGAQVREVVDRALDRARTDPPGPVYLSLPREVLAAPTFAAPAGASAPVPTRAHPDPAAVDTLAEHLATARFPLIVTGDSGADHACVATLADLAGRYGIGVVESGPRHVSLPADHPMHLGYRPGEVLADADVVVTLDLDVPWLPAAVRPADDAVVVQVGPDPHFSRYPIRSHRSDLTITAACGPLISALGPALQARADRIDTGRTSRIEELGGRWRARRQALLDAERAPGDGPITKATMNAALASVIDSGTVVVNEYWAQAEVLAPTVPGSYLGTPPAGGLGWGLPAAIGVKLARPDATVISTLGDGAYLFANPAACHQAMAMHGLPVLTVVCSNDHWGAVQASALKVHPDGHAAASADLSPLARLDPVPAFETYAEASGGVGIRVRSRAELVPALEKALRVVRSEGRQALVNVDCL
ncbi:acetolactate synthase [Pseudonocardia sulfidoxydans NBRC 16205]|uniref:Acetolactate synthase n=2 Tax=Pseudonocardia sulfidoxydans TaxID=54011 RepID=A0A511DAY0_9PSEU|nr:thiamine pyrophosphate-requiring protein [Pseudonocardia sulfidoxydans]GEL21962.1 acetolactate synthase [Pseudonocardia sulfidoxydans NBRC 16205]